MHRAQQQCTTVQGKLSLRHTRAARATHQPGQQVHHNKTLSLRGRCLKNQQPRRKLLRRYLAGVLYFGFHRKSTFCPLSVKS